MSAAAPVSLFAPLTLRGVTFRNRIGVSPMCQYSAADGMVNDWHLTHLGARAAGGAGLVIMEATGVVPEGRITPGCTGIWSDAHAEVMKPITAFIEKQGAVAGIQIAHAGRKASCDLPWRGGNPLAAAAGAWQTVAPSAIAFQDGHPVPREMTIDDIRRTQDAFVVAARRAVSAGFRFIELHGAHGYLMHEFFSPLSNKREDAYGGSFENRARFILETARAVRTEIPADVVLAARLSCSDWAAGGVTIDESVTLSAALQQAGVDIIDCSSGGNVHDAKIAVGPGYQVPFAAQIRRDAGVPTAAVGMINEARQADEIIRKGEADIALLARAFLRDPYWAVHAAIELGAEPDIPPQYLRGYHQSRTASPAKKAG
ncbi:MAG TPA: NADH:flavin oxidoreductase/NADH oxidase [Alphaproteobacteria bacterium]|nr:NADH:flavin oxidoreductase/NADH oxidase [Alphaproteobacteria bacterium]